jgi:RNA polymerase sigma-70 factor (ECF subfamily)
MKYTYKFVDGVENDVEVSEELLALLNEFDRQEKKNDRRETRRHVSMDKLAGLGIGVPDHTQEIDFVLERNHYYNKERWLEYIQKKVFSKYLTERQAEVFYLHKILGYNNSKIARQLNVTEGAIRKLIEKAKDKILVVVCQRFEMKSDFTFKDVDFEDVNLLEDLLSP